jgi:hypothetical protein
MRLFPTGPESPDKIGTSRSELRASKHKADYHKVVCVSMYIMDIIRMEWEGVEKAWS